MLTRSILKGEHGVVGVKDISQVNQLLRFRWCHWLGSERKGWWAGILAKPPHSVGTEVLEAYFTVLHAYLSNCLIFVYPSTLSVHIHLSTHVCSFAVCSYAVCSNVFICTICPLSYIPLLPSLLLSVSVHLYPLSTHIHLVLHPPT